MNPHVFRRRHAAYFLFLFCYGLPAFGQNPLINAVGTAPIRNNYSGFVGTEFTVGASAIAVTSLGRAYLAGNTGTHTIKLVDALTGNDLPGTSVSLTMTIRAANSFQYAPLTNSVQLAAGHSYYLLSQETAGGDFWYDLATVGGSSLPLTGSVYTDTAGRYVFVPNTSGTSYVTPNMLYTPASAGPPQGMPLVTSQSLGPARNNFSGFVGMEFSTSSDVFEVTSLGRYVMPGNTQTHQVKLVDATTGVDIPGASASVNVSGATPGTYVYSNLPAPVTLQIYHNYLLLSQESNGGDKWADIGVVITSQTAIIGPVYQSSNGFTLVSYAGYSYVPVNLGYIDLGNDSGPSVTVTSPTPNQTLANSAFNVQATVIPTAAEPIQSVQVLLDFSTKVGSIPGSAIVNNVATIPIDLTAATNGMHYLTVRATDAAGATGSAQVNVLVSGPTSTTPFLSSFTPTFLRNNFTGYVGMQFTVGSAALSVPSLGRYCVAGNAASHTIVLTAANASLTPSYQTSVSMAGCTPGQYVYANLYSPAILSAGSSFYLTDYEQVGGDQWYDYAHVTTTSAASINGAAYNAFNSYVTVPAASTCYGPLNFLYTSSSSSPGGLLVSIASANGTASAPLVTVNAASTSPITSVLILIDGASLTPPLTAPPYTQTLPTTSYGYHSLTAIARDAAGDTVTSAPYIAQFLLPYGVDFVQLVVNSSGPLRNNYTGWVGFQFTTGTTTAGPNGVTINVDQPGFIGQACVAGNSTVPHLIKLVRASDGSDLSYVYLFCGGIAPLNIGVAPGTTYYLVSQEVAGGDKFSDIGPAIPQIGNVGGAGSTPFYRALPSTGRSTLTV